MQKQRVTPLLSVRRLSKRFGHVKALHEVDLDLQAGEVVGLVGDNGAGKSTLIKVLAGTLRPDAGEILVDGRPVGLRSPKQARLAGIETVYQDLALAPDLDGVANLFLGRELQPAGPGRFLGALAERTMRQRAPGLLGRLSKRLPELDVPVGSLSGGQRQIIAVARAVAWAHKVVLMDEPTAALGVQQTEQVIELARETARRGLGVLVVSHNLPELLTLVDRVVVLRLGQVAAELTAAEATTTALLGAMTGLVDDERIPR